MGGPQETILNCVLTLTGMTRNWLFMPVNFMLFSCRVYARFCGRATGNYSKLCVDSYRHIKEGCLFVRPVNFRLYSCRIYIRFVEGPQATVLKCVYVCRLLHTMS